MQFNVIAAQSMVILSDESVKSLSNIFTLAMTNTQREMQRAKNRALGNAILPISEY